MWCAQLKVHGNVVCAAGRAQQCGVCSCERGGNMVHGAGRGMVT